MHPDQRDGGIPEGSYYVEDIKEFFRNRIPEVRPKDVNVYDAYYRLMETPNGKAYLLSVLDKEISLLKGE